MPTPTPADKPTEDVSVDHELTDEQLLEQLCAAYKPTEVPPCRVCGAPLRVVAIDTGRSPRYACVALAMGNMDWDHYRRSQWEDYRRGGDSRVVDLVERFKRLKGALE